MDPFGFAASVATVAEMALKVFTNLNTFYRKFRDAPQHSKELRDGLDLLVDLLTEVQDTLEGGPRANRYGPPLKEFDQIKQWLSELQKRTTPQSTHGIIRRLQWPFHEQENETIIKQIETLKGSLDTRIGTQTLY
jgi:hypothetical protein